MKDYCWYTSGEYIGILEWDDSYGRYDSPTEDVSEGIIIEHTETITDPTDYDSSINLNRNLINAIVDFLKYKMNNDIDPKRARLYYNDFLAKVEAESARETLQNRQVWVNRVWGLV